MPRRPAVAGTFYEANEAELLGDLERCFCGDFGPGRLPEAPEHRIGNVIGLVSPHAGYIYSGGAAAFAYLALAEDGLPDTVVMLGPNHYGMGAPVAVSPDEAWTTPLGTLARDDETAREIARLCGFAREDELPHLREHSIEVQLPFLQFVGGSQVRIVAISIAHLSLRDAIEAASELGAAMASALKGKSAAIIASTDLSHYESQARADAQDSLAIEQMLRLDGHGLLETVYSRDITMCGAIGTAAMIEAAKILGATQAQQLVHYTSGDVTGDTRQVVGYGAIRVEKG